MRSLRSPQIVAAPRRAALRSRYVCAPLPRARLSGGALRAPRVSGGSGAAIRLSPFYFNRVFLQAFNETPHEFITRPRIEQPKKLLLAGNHSVTEICFEIGYASRGSFSTRFHSPMGHSPAAFRDGARRTFARSRARAVVLRQQYVNLNQRRT